MSLFVTIIVIVITASADDDRKKSDQEYKNPFVYHSNYVFCFYGSKRTRVLRDPQIKSVNIRFLSVNKLD